MLIDSFGRRVDYLRLSVTDRCNLRCVYCLPESFAAFAKSADTMSDDEIVSLASLLVQEGVSSVRITGGEPLVRPGLERLVARLVEAGVKDLSLSTNGVLLALGAQALRKAGLRRVNVSLDSLDPGRFARVTRFGKLADVLDGIEAALEAGLEPVKVNVVVAHGMNFDEVGRFADWTERRPVHVRFIELMPMGETGFYSPERRATLAELAAAARPLEPVPAGERPAGKGPAAYFRRPGGRGTVGFISAVSCGFCSSCNRVRLSARGTLIGCLDGEEGVDLLGALRRGAGRGELRGLVFEALRAKPERHSMRERAAGATRTMCSVGG